MTHLDPLVAIVLLPALMAATGVVAALAVRPLPAGAAETDEDLLATLLTGLGLGFGLLPALAFLVFYALFFWHVSWLSVALAMSLGLGGCLGWWRWGRPDRGAHRLVPPGLEGLLKRHRVGLGAVVLVGVFYLLKFDRSLFAVGEGCLHRGGLAAVGAIDAEVNLFAEIFADARLGNVAMLSPFLALFQSFGFRVLYAVCGLLLAMGGYVTGFLLTGRRGWGIAGLVLLALNPYILKIPLLDENLLTLAVSAVFFPWLLRGRAPWLVVGLLASLALGMRHILVLAVPALLFIVWMRARGGAVRSSAPGHSRSLPPGGGHGVGAGRALLLLVGALVVGTLPYHVHHLLAQGSLLRFESFGQLPAFPHDFGFGTVQWEGLLNWPFHAQVVRTPHNSHPTFLLWPLWVADHFGLLLCAAALLGIGAGFARDRWGALFRLGYFLPVYGMLAVQENWDYVNKMNVLLIAFVPALEWTLLGLHAVVRRPRLYAPVWAGLVVLAWLGVRAAAPYEAPIDARYVQTFPESGYEPPGLLAHQRQVATDVALWPDFGRIGEFQEHFGLDRLRELPQHLRDPAFDSKTPFGWSQAEIPAPGEPVVVTLDLSRPPWGRRDLVRLDSGGAVDVDLTATDATPVVGPFHVPWADRPLVLYLTPAGAPVAGAMLVFQDRPDPVDRNYMLSLLLGGATRVGPEETVRLHRDGPVERLRLRVPAGALSVVWRINPHAYRSLHWKARVTPEGVETQRHRWVYHD